LVRLERSGMPITKLSSEILLLDTHVWIWLMNADPHLKRSKWLPIIEKAVEKNRVTVSIISVWEVAMLEAKNRIVLPYSLYEWVHRALGDAGIALASLTPEIAIESTRFPETSGLDPADRILMATAKSLGALLLTRDEKILSYGKKHNLQSAAV